MVLQITPVYAALATLFFVFLSARVILMRRTVRVALGDGGDRSLLRRQRVHGNFAEYVPLAVILMTLAELQGAPASALHLVGVILIGGRLIHAYGVSREQEVIRIRVYGMVLTFTALVSGALLNLGVGLAAVLSSA